MTAFESAYIRTLEDGSLQHKVDERYGGFQGSCSLFYNPFEFIVLGLREQFTVERCVSVRPRAQRINAVHYFLRGSARRSQE